MYQIFQSMRGRIKRGNIQTAVSAAADLRQLTLEKLVDLVLDRERLIRMPNLFPAYSLWII
jgi:hypothetical protein